MKEHFKSALDRIEADDALVSKTETRLRNELAQGQHSGPRLMKGRIYEMKKLAIAACMALLLIGGGFAYATPVSYLSVDINPSVELGINTLGQVVSIEAFNEDGKDDLSDLHVKGMKVKEAVGVIIDAAADKGFIKDDGSSVVLLTVTNDDKEKADQLTTAAEEGAEAALAENEASAEVSQAAISKARRAAASDPDIDISPGKMNLIQKLWEVTENDGVAVTADDYDTGAIVEFAKTELGESDKTYADSSVKEIMKAIKEARTEAKIDAANTNNSEENDADEPGKGTANVPDQQMKADTEDVDDQDSNLPKGKDMKKDRDKTDDEERE